MRTDLRRYHLHACDDPEWVQHVGHSYDPFDSDHETLEAALARAQERNVRWWMVYDWEERRTVAASWYEVEVK